MFPLFCSRRLRANSNLKGVIRAAKVHYGTSLSNVDWLHGGAEFFLTLTNLFIVLGLRQALRAQQRQEDCEKGVVEEEDTLGSAK